MFFSLLAPHLLPCVCISLYVCVCVCCMRCCCAFASLTIITFPSMDGSTNEGEPKVKEPRDPSRASDIKLSPGTNVDYQILGGLEGAPRPVVTICVESPMESPDQDGGGATASAATTGAVAIPIDPEPIDVNLPRDTSNIFYDYEEQSGPAGQTVSAGEAPNVEDTAVTVEIANELAECKAGRRSPGSPGDRHEQPSDRPEADLPAQSS